MPSVPEATGHAEPRGASRWTQLFGDAATYTVGDILNRLFPFLLLPVLTRYLTPAEYGTFVMFQVVVNFLLPLVGLNVEAAVYPVIELVRCGLLVPRWAGEPARAFLRYGLPLVPHRVSGWLTGMADRVIIAKLTSLGQVGIYSVGYSIGTAVALVQEAFNRAWVPFFFDRL